MTDAPDERFLHGPPPAALTEMLADVEDESIVRRYDADADEWQIDCRLCGGRDEQHTDRCPLPAISRWLDDQGKLGA